MGKAISVMSRPLRDFNLESRAHKVISKEKPTAAPKYKSDELTYERMMKENPSAFQESLAKDTGLDKHLKDVYVTSHDPLPQPPAASSSAERPLPLDRTAVPESEFGFREPSKVPYGRVTLRNALKFIGRHQTKPIEYPISRIAEEYKLSEETVQNIVKYFKIYEVYIPTEHKVKAKFAGPVVTRKQVFTHKKKELPEGKD
ncbi:hypothetical protein ILUMI_14304 [Ignelater luminosus]|uniref:Protein NDUFAF4 homolog n=1 Tax=Ignelater luminosus TaxID=2038154 RepID=A0A8K0GB24_IGNLU|nr:hypothetical protein ILUMI_14304 [Ignelater luminosus]